MQLTRVTHEKVIRYTASGMLQELIHLLNGETSLGEKVRGFIDKVRQLRAFGSSEQDRLASAPLVRQINAEIGERARMTATKLVWIPGLGAIWEETSVSDDSPHDYESWVWKVIDLGHEGYLDFLGLCSNAACKKVFRRQRRARGAAEHCSPKCCQMAYRTTSSYKNMTNPSKRDYMRRKRTDDTLMHVTRGEWDHLKAAGYVYLNSGICRCGASVEWWKIPRRKNVRGIRPKITRLPLQKRNLSKGAPRVCSHLQCQREKAMGAGESQPQG